MLNDRRTLFLMQCNVHSIRDVVFGMLKHVETGISAINEYNSVLFEINELCYLNVLNTFSSHTMFRLFVGLLSIYVSKLQFIIFIFFIKSNLQLNIFKCLFFLLRKLRMIYNVMLLIEYNTCSLLMLNFC